MLIGVAGRRFSKRRPAPLLDGRKEGEALRLVEVTKWYGSVEALDRVTISVDHGEVVALVGDNGAGKSTLVNIVAGVVRADGGEFYVEGGQVDIGSPTDARSLGIRTVHQEQKLAENLDVVENLFLGDELVRGAGPPARSRPAHPGLWPGRSATPTVVRPSTPVPPAGGVVRPDPAGKAWRRGVPPACSARRRTGRCAAARRGRNLRRPGGPPYPAKRCPGCHGPRRPPVSGEALPGIG